MATAVGSVLLCNVADAAKAPSASGRLIPAGSECPIGPECGTLTWRDEFEPSSAGAPNPTHWGFDLGATGWGNRELQEYTDSRANSAIGSDGILRIVARSRTGSGAGYTSARLVSRDRVTVGYGYVEARLKLPVRPASGLWPAFWLRSQGEPWPDGGEIDVMETVNGTWGYSSNIHGGPVHWQQYKWHSTGAVNDGEWHRFGVLIGPQRLDFYHDGVLVHTVTPKGMPAGGRWPFDVPDRRYYLILNMAMGGAYPGTPDGSAQLPATMQVDYVRYWTRSTGSTGRRSTEGYATPAVPTGRRP
ncbi:MAG: glycoside hydrolase family 16 protein [Micropruina sp.]|uniref:glycoside hydrolase family 16 protein n=1 Tax=Micropruina sp. TaxID=2737536 RepID=UPI0039E4E72A